MAKEWKYVNIVGAGDNWVQFPDAAEKSAALFRELGLLPNEIINLGECPSRSCGTTKLNFLVYTDQEIPPPVK